MEDIGSVMAQETALILLPEVKKEVKTELLEDGIGLEDKGFVMTLGTAMVFCPEVKPEVKTEEMGKDVHWFEDNGFVMTRGTAMVFPPEVKPEVKTEEMGKDVHGFDDNAFVMSHETAMVFFSEVKTEVKTEEMAEKVHRFDDNGFVMSHETAMVFFPEVKMEVKTEEMAKNVHWFEDNGFVMAHETAMVFLPEVKTEVKTEAMSEAGDRFQDKESCTQVSETGDYGEVFGDLCKRCDSSVKDRPETGSLTKLPETIARGGRPISSSTRKTKKECPFLDEFFDLVESCEASFLSTKYAHTLYQQAVRAWTDDEKQRAIAASSRRFALQFLNKARKSGLRDLQQMEQRGFKARITADWLKC